MRKADRVRIKKVARAIRDNVPFTDGYPSPDERARHAAAALIPEAATDGDAFFVETSRRFLTGFLHHAQTENPKKK